MGLRGAAGGGGGGVTAVRARARFGCCLPAGKGVVQPPQGAPSFGAGSQQLSNKTSIGLMWWFSQMERNWSTRARKPWNFYGEMRGVGKRRGVLGTGVKCAVAGELEKIACQSVAPRRARLFVLDPKEVVEKNAEGAHAWGKEGRSECENALTI